MDINTKRFIDRDNKGFLNKWYHKRWDKYYNKWLINKKDITQWGEEHPLKSWWIKLPMMIEAWFVCGFKIQYDKNVLGHWTWIEHYHLFVKLARYKTWHNYRITWWDKIRFYIVTGYKFENE